MFEVALLLVATFALTSGGVVVWRLVRGPAQQEPAMAARTVVVSLVAGSLVVFGTL